MFTPNDPNETNETEATETTEQTTEKLSDTDLDNAAGGKVFQ